MARYTNQYPTDVIDPKRIDRSKLAPRSYYEGVIEEMKKLGFELLSWVTMESSKHEYHVNLHPFSMHSMLFFYYPGGTFIVKLTYVQHIGVRHFDTTLERYYFSYEEYEQRWSGAIIINFDYKAKYVDLWKKHWKEHGLTVDYEEDVPYALEDHFYLNRYDDALKPNSVFWLSHSIWDDHGTRSQSLEQYVKGVLDPAHMVTVFGEILTELKPYLYRRFRELSPLAFEPYYCFPAEASRKHFWNKFNVGRLRKLVERFDPNR